MMKALRMARGETMVDVYTATGISTSQQCVFEAGTLEPSISMQRRLEDHYGQTWDVLRRVVTPDKLLAAFTRRRRAHASAVAR